MLLSDQSQLGRYSLRLLAVYLVVCAMAVTAQDRIEDEDPLTCREILMLLEGGTEQSRIVELVEHLRTNCTLEENVETFRELVLAGASLELLNAIGNNRYSEVIIVSPKPGAEVGATARIEGESARIEGKYLWVFSHREGLGVWWPQGGTVELKDDGSWRQGVFLGTPEDIGFDFVITAIWVDGKTNRELKDYLARGEKTQHYPGISLPDGSPSAEVVVHKVRH